MKYKLITTFKPADWDKYSRKMVESVIQNWPDADVTVYYEKQKPNFQNENVTWIDIDQANLNLHNFREKYSEDPVALGKLDAIPGGVRRSPKLDTEGGLDAKKESYLWNAVKFSYKVSCVTHAVKTYTDYDYVIWLDDDTYTFRNIPMEFLQKICPSNTLLTYLGREGNGKNLYPECGLVAYNMNHQLIQNFVNDWENLYTSAEIFNLLEWHDSYVFWHMTKEYKAKHNIMVNDIGYAAGVVGHHVFINSVLGAYIDHFKGTRKDQGKSLATDLKTKFPVDYWDNVD